MPTMDNDWLQPEDFDWAEDVEDDLLKKSQPPCPTSIASNGASVARVDDSRAHGSNEIYPQNSGLSPKDKFNNNGDQCLESIEEEVEYESDDTFGPFYEEEEFEMLTPATSQGPLPAEVDPQAIENFQLAFSEVEAEFSWRDCHTHMDPSIHHYNFLGQSVYEASATPPAQSLAIIMSGPKAPEAREDLRVQSILTRANMFVDPVILNLDGIDESILHQRGFALQRAATGRASTFYTPHGSWMGDNSEQTAFNVCDTGDVYTYVSDDVAVGNGFIGRGCIASREDWFRMRDERMSPVGHGGLPRKMTWSPKPSPLRESTTLVDSTKSEPTVEDSQPHADHQQSAGSSRSQTELPILEAAHGELRTDNNEEYQTFGSSNQPNTIIEAPKKTHRWKSKRKKRQLQRQHPAFISRREGPDESVDSGTYFSFPEPSFSTGKKWRFCRILQQIWDFIVGSFTTLAELPDDGNEVFSL